MAEIEVFGQKMILARNPWLKAGMAKKSYYLREPQEWVLDKSKLSAGQKRVNEKFTELVYRSIKNFPADGTLKTLKRRVKWIGAQMKDEKIKGYDTIDKLKVKVPITASDSHPKVLEIAERYGVSAEDVLRKLREKPEHPTIMERVTA